VAEAKQAKLKSSWIKPSQKPKHFGQFKTTQLGLNRWSKRAIKKAK
jgi:hypothetical protein